MAFDDFFMKVKKENILHNYRYLKESKKKEIIAVVKANAYGHGIEQVVKLLQEEGCKYFAVARIWEAKKILRLKLKNIKVLVLETIEELELLKVFDELEIFINSISDLKKALSKGISTSQMHLKIDFGFGRNGILESEIKELEKIIQENNLKFKGIATHLFDCTHEDMLDIENKFDKIISNLGRDRFEMIHSQNSAGVISIEGKGCTHIRCGTILFGLQEIGYYDPYIKRSIFLVGKISGIKEVKNLKYIGYEKKENLNILDTDKVAKIRIGYGDGLSKRSENIMSIINNKKYKIIHISMDSSFVVVDDSVKVGDEIEIFHDLEEAIDYLKVPHYEFLSCINDRIERVLI